MQNTLTREHKRKALEIARLDDWGDPFGTAMLHSFAIADTIEHMGGDCPPHWQYHHGAICKGVLPDVLAFQAGDESADPLWPDCEYVPFMDAGEFGIELLTYAGNVLDRYLAFVKRAGRDY